MYERPERVSMQFDKPSIEELKQEEEEEKKSEPSSPTMSDTSFRSTLAPMMAVADQSNQKKLFMVEKAARKLSDNTIASNQSKINNLMTVGLQGDVTAVLTGSAQADPTKPNVDSVASLIAQQIPAQLTVDTSFASRQVAAQLNNDQLVSVINSDPTQNFL